MADTQNHLAALIAQRDALTMRMGFEQRAREDEQKFADKQAQILQRMLHLARQELDRTKQLRDKGMVSQNEIARAETGIQELELRMITNDENLSRQNAASNDLQAAMAETETKINSFETLLQDLDQQREEISKSRVVLSEEPRLKFEQELALEMIQKSNLRILDPELDMIRHKALLTMVERQLKGKTKAKDDETGND